MHCEITTVGLYSSDMCWQYRLRQSKFTDVPAYSSEAMVNGRVGLGAVVIALYVAYFIMALMAVLRKHRHGGHDVKMGSAEGIRNSVS